MTNKLTQMLDESEAQDPIRIAAEKKARGPHKAVVINPMTDGNEHLREDHAEPEGEHEFVNKTPGTKSYGVTGQRNIELAGETFKIVRKDPYGFWYFQGKNVPKRLKDTTYTSVSEAERAITLHINHKSELPKNIYGPPTGSARGE